MSTRIKVTLTCRTIEQVGAVVALAQSTGIEVDMSTEVDRSRRRGEGEAKPPRLSADAMIEVQDEPIREEGWRKMQGTLRKKRKLRGTKAEIIAALGHSDPRVGAAALSKWIKRGYARVAEGEKQ